jgi:hypothetical protein
MTRFFGLFKKKASRLTKRMEQVQEAVAFAEAGELESARRLLHEEATEELPGRLLVIGRESTFSSEVINYSLEMAKRMSYDILALNTTPLSSETFKIFSSSHKQLCRDFRALAQENVKEFRKEAERLSVPFVHVVKFIERDQAIEEINHEFKDIEFVVSDAEQEGAVNRMEEGERPAQPIYVYSML